MAGGHLTPKLVGFLDPLDREFLRLSPKFRVSDSCAR